MCFFFVVALLLLLLLFRIIKLISNSFIKFFSRCTVLLFRSTMKNICYKCARSHSCIHGKYFIFRIAIYMYVYVYTFRYKESFFFYIAFMCRFFSFCHLSLILLPSSFFVFVYNNFFFAIFALIVIHLFGAITLDT